MTTHQPNLGECPACHSDLDFEPDPRMRTGYAVVCNNAECPDGGGAWCATEPVIAKWKAAFASGEKN